MSKILKILLLIFLFLVIAFVIFLVIRYLLGSKAGKVTKSGLITSQKDKQEECLAECAGKFNEEDEKFLECLEECADRVGIVAEEREGPWCPQNLEEVRQLREWGHKKIGGDIPPWDLTVQSFREGRYCYEADDPRGQFIKDYEGVGKYEFEEETFKEYAK